jgi:hypothetical protein
LDLANVTFFKTYIVDVFFSQRSSDANDARDLDIELYSYLSSYLFLKMTGHPIDAVGKYSVDFKKESGFVELTLDYDDRTL